MCAASGTITQLVPPSLVLVVLADQLNRSVGDVQGYQGPSILQVLLFALYTFLLSRVRPTSCPACPRGALSSPALVIKCLRGIIPSFVPDLRRARQHGRPARHQHRHLHAHRGRRDGRGRRLRARRMHLAASSGSLVRGAMAGTMRDGGVHPSSARALFSLVFQGVDGGRWIDMDLGCPAAGQASSIVA